MYGHPTASTPDQSAPCGCDKKAPPPRLTRRVLLGGAAGALASACLAIHTAEAKRTTTEARIDQIIRTMTIAEKAAQLFVIGAAGTSMSSSFHDLLADLQPGGVLFFAPNIGPAPQLCEF